MNSESSTKRLQAFWDALTIIVFLGLLWLPTLDYFFKLDHAEEPGENRLPGQVAGIQRAWAKPGVYYRGGELFQRPFRLPQAAGTLE